MKDPARLRIFLVTTLLFLFTLSINLNTAQAQCNTPPGAAGISMAGGFGGCIMTVSIIYDCGNGIQSATCSLDAGGDGFNLPAGCCVLSVKVVTPQHGAYSVSPSNPNQSVSTSGWTYGSNPCDNHPVTNIDWDFPGGPCQAGVIHVN